MISFWKEMFKIMKFLFFRSEDWPELIIGVSEVSNGHIFTNFLFSSSTSKSVFKESYHFEKTKQNKT